MQERSHQRKSSAGVLPTGGYDPGHVPFCASPIFMFLTFEFVHSIPIQPICLAECTLAVARCSYSAAAAHVYILHSMRMTAVAMLLLELLVYNTETSA
jgi:hypothetical protein